MTSVRLFAAYLGVVWFFLGHASILDKMDRAERESAAMEDAVRALELTEAEWKPRIEEAKEAVEERTKLVETILAAFETIESPESLTVGNLIEMGIGMQELGGMRSWAPATAGFVEMGLLTPETLILVESVGLKDALTTANEASKKAVLDAVEEAKAAEIKLKEDYIKKLEDEDLTFMDWLRALGATLIGVLLVAFAWRGPPLAWAEIEKRVDAAAARARAAASGGSASAPAPAPAPAPATPKLPEGDGDDDTAELELEDEG